MSVFYVFQGDTYSIERTDGYLWPPRLNKAGHRNIGYDTMTKVKNGDFILHNANGRIVSISIAQADCHNADRPASLASGNTVGRWDTEGYRIDTEYHDFDTPVVATQYQDWLINHYDERSAFTQQGRGKQQYLCNLADEHAIFFIEKALELNGAQNVRRILNAAMADIVGDMNSEYSQVEIEAINKAIGEAHSPQTLPWIDQDIDTTVAGGGSEWNKIETNLNASPTGFKLLHVKAARVKIGLTWYDIAGLAYKDWIVVTDASSSKKRTVAHEMLHILTLKDVGPYGKNTANIMYYASNTTQYFVGYFKVERVQTGSGASYTPRQYQLQWDAIKRTTD